MHIHSIYIKYRNRLVLKWNVCIIYILLVFMKGAFYSTCKVYTVPDGNLRSTKHIPYWLARLHFAHSDSTKLTNTKSHFRNIQALESLLTLRIMIRKEGNDQESIQLPYKFQQRHQREIMTYWKQRHHNQNTTRRKPKGQFLSPKLAKRLSKIKNSPGRTCKDIKWQK